MWLEGLAVGRFPGVFLVPNAHSITYLLDNQLLLIYVVAFHACCLLYDYTLTAALTLLILPMGSCSGHVNRDVSTTAKARLVTTWR